MEPRTRRRITFGIVGVAAILAASAIALKWRDSVTYYRPEVLLSRFPVEDAAVFSADVAALRAAGLLAVAAQAPEAEYRQFLAESGFDYRRDLDYLAVSLANSGTYIIARGRFDWEKLADYARRGGGDCFRRFCRMQGSKPERRISFFPLRDDTIALAVAPRDNAAEKLEYLGPKLTARLPADPVWLAVPGAFLKSRELIPLSLRVTFSGIVNADRVIFSAVAAGQGIELNMQATCRTAQDAGVLASQLRNAASKIAPGTFAQRDKIVTGKWPVSRTTLESLLEGL